MIFQTRSAKGCRTYFIAGEESRECLLVDPVLEEVPAVLELLDRERWTLTHVFDTHTHADHLSGAAALTDRTGCAYVMHDRTAARCVTQRVREGEVLRLGAATLSVMHTPGHTRDGICLIADDRLLTGDTLFLDDGGAGRDDLPGGDPGEHFDSLQRLLTLPEHLIVHPAHDYRDRAASTLAQQKGRNPHFSPRSRGEFVRYLEDLRLGPADWMKEVLKANHACTRDPKAVRIPSEGSACEVRGTLAKGAAGLRVPQVTACELKEKLEGGRAPVLLDVRELHELTGELGHLPGSIHIPIGMLGARTGELSKEAESVIVCRSGVRAATAAQILSQEGFARMSVLTGGMIEWNRRGYPVTRDLPVRG